MEDNIWQLMITDIAFHRTSTIPIPLKSVPPPFGIITTIFQAHNTAIYPQLKAVYMMATNFSQLPRSGSSSRFAPRSHVLRCSALITDGHWRNVVAAAAPPRKIFLLWYIIIHWEGGHLYGNKLPWRQDMGI